jgi:hypothetical protein
MEFEVINEEFEGKTHKTFYSGNNNLMSSIGDNKIQDNIE